MGSLLARDWSMKTLVWRGRRYNKSLNRSGISAPFIRKTRMLDSLLPARLIPPLGCFMSVLTDYEKTVVRSLVTGVLSHQHVEAVIREGEFMDYDYTGCGYFLTIKHPL